MFISLNKDNQWIDLSIHLCKQLQRPSNRRKLRSKNISIVIKYKSGHLGLYPALESQRWQVRRPKCDSCVSTRMEMLLYEQLATSKSDRNWIEMNKATWFNAMKFHSKFDELTGKYILCSTNAVVNNRLLQRQPAFDELSSAEHNFLSSRTERCDLKLTTHRSSDLQWRKPNLLLGRVALVRGVVGYSS